MNRFKLFILQLKTAFIRIFAGLLVMAALFGILGIVGIIAVRGSSLRALASKEGLREVLAADDNGSGRITVAVVCNDLLFTDYVFTLAGDIPGVNRLCDLVKMSREEGINALQTGDISMVIEIPDYFYAGASAMQNASMTVYTDGTHPAAVYKLLAMLGSASELVKITDAQIMSMYDGISAYAIPVERSEMEWTLFGNALSGFENRTEGMEVITVSAFGSYDVWQYYITSALLCMTMVGSVPLLGMYTRGQLQLERMLHRGSRAYLSAQMTKVLAMWISLGSICELFGILLNLVLTNHDIPMPVTIRFHISIWITALSIVLWIHLTASVAGSDSAHLRVTYVMFIILALMASGAVLPVVYLPSAIRRVSGYIYTGALHRLLLSGMWDRGRIRALSSINGLTVTIITDAIVCVISFILYGRGLSKHD